jgi:glyoxylase-like metal-dependent hydrolase (beta-lactamase superfamily II)
VLKGTFLFTGHGLELPRKTITAPEVFAFYAKNASELNAQVQALSAKLGKKPLRYAVNTSAHGDHSYGNMYLTASTSLTKRAARALSSGESPRRFHITMCLSMPDQARAGPTWRGRRSLRSHAGCVINHPNERFHLSI